MAQPRGRSFEPSNKMGRGRPPGSRNKASKLADKLLREHSEALIRKCILMAMQGDSAMMRLCLDHILPRRKEAGSLHVPQNQDATETLIDLSHLNDEEFAALEKLAAKVHQKPNDSPESTRSEGVDTPLETAA
jgi:hypothetical protein